MSETKVLSRTQRYMARVSAHLPTLGDDAERREFIIEQLAKFEESYEAFRAKVDRGGDPGDITAFDFVETIGALQIELSKVSEFKQVRAGLNADTAEMRARMTSLGEVLQ
jgi:hypothetical protein